MIRSLTADLVAKTLQKLEAIRHNEAEVLNDEECQKRASEVAEAALQAIAVCTKYLISRNAEVRIDGLGDFHMEKTGIQFVPDEDVLQYVLLKHQEPEQQQLALRNAFIGCLSNAQKILPLLDLDYGQSVTSEASGITPEDKLLKAIFGEELPTEFSSAVSVLISGLVTGLRAAGATIRGAEVASLAGKSQNSPVDVEYVDRGDVGDVLHKDIQKAILGTLHFEPQKPDFTGVIHKHAVKKTVKTKPGEAGLKE